MRKEFINTKLPKDSVKLREIWLPYLEILRNMGTIIPDIQKLETLNNVPAVYKRIAAVLEETEKDIRSFRMELRNEVYYKTGVRLLSREDKLRKEGKLTFDDEQKIAKMKENMKKTKQFLDE